MSSQDSLLDSQGLPLYQTVRNRLLKELSLGTWKPGDMLPTEVELAREFSVSLGTVRQAILILVREGRLTRTAGRGTFVERLDASRSFARFFRFREAMGQSSAPSIKLLDVKILRDPPQIVADHLQIDVSAPVLRIHRVLMSGDTPVCLYRSYLPHDLVSGLEDDDLSSDRLYALIEKRRGLYVVKAEELLRAGIASAGEAEVLGIQEADAIIRIERTAYTYGGKVMEWRETIGRSDTFHYKITMP